MSNIEGKTFFAPELFINNGIKDISFYEAAFGAIELRRFSNDDGTIHVAELSINGALFHLHETTAKPYFMSPGANNGTTVCIGLFVPDVDAVMNKAIKAGSITIHPAQDYDYGYRQGTIKDPFGHYWQIQSVINEKASL
jgi:PhnB protein